MHRTVALIVLALALAIASGVPALAQCTKDIECKGDRVCVSGQCQDPGAQSIASVCGLAGAIPAGISLGLATKEGRQILQAIGKAAGLENMPRIVTGPVPNAAAAIENRERLIIYNNSFIESMRRQSGDWAVQFVFAHELGHHVEGHTVTGRGSTHEFEYQADAFATRQLKRLGATRSQTTKAMEAMPAPASGTHPSSEDRLSRIRAVYDEPGSATGIEEPAEPFPNPAPQRTPQPASLPQPLKLASGAPALPCGCHGFALPGATRPNPYCASGFDVAVPCAGWCFGGGQPWGTVCK